MHYPVYTLLNATFFVMQSIVTKHGSFCYKFDVKHLLLSFHSQEYSEDSNSEPDVDLENQYYNSKALKEDDPRAALESFQKVNVEAKSKKRRHSLKIHLNIQTYLTVKCIK